MNTNHPDGWKALSGVLVVFDIAKIIVRDCNMNVADCIGINVQIKSYTRKSRARSLWP
jgi:hypothetical protein